MRTLTGIPGLASIPGLNQLTSEVTNEQDDDELLVTITPHVISNSAHDQNSEIWMGSK
jgi:type II secretory pathway component GspD/PulD (secretin)